MIERLALRTPFEMTRASPFAYLCRRCSACCQGKRIPLDPYEVARLAQFLGLTTTDLLARHTTNGGALLAVGDDSTCVFLGESGCRVHAARPLACRLYPLGRRVSPGHVEQFAAVVPDAGCQGEYGGPGTVADYLEQQETVKFLAAADAYRTVLEKLVAALLKREDVADCCPEVDQMLARSPRREDESLLDMDVVVGRRCAELGVEVPGDVEQRTRMHLELLGAIE
jgi:Fe-S-cluster containining protein